MQLDPIVATYNDLLSDGCKWDGDFRGCELMSIVNIQNLTPRPESFRHLETFHFFVYNFVRALQLKSIDV